MTEDKVELAANTVEFYGQSFRLRTKVSEYALLKFARAAQTGEDAESLNGMATMLHLLEKCIVVEDWPRFDRLADENDASSEEVVEVIRAAFSQQTERPTGRPSGSSDGPTTTEPKSAANSADSGSVFAGRPDLQILIRDRTSA